MIAVQNNSIYTYGVDLKKIPEGREKVDLHKAMFDIFKSDIWVTRGILWSVPCPLVRGIDRTLAYKIKYFLEKIPGVEAEVHLEIDENENERYSG